MLNLAGPSVIYLPRVVSRMASQDGWICVAVITLLVLVCVRIISILSARFPGMGFCDYAGLLISRPAAKLLCVFFALKTIMSCSMELRVFGELARERLLPLTPFWVVASVLLALGAYAAMKGFEVVGRIAEILFFVFFIPLGLLIIFSAKDLDLSNLLPVFSSSPEEIISGSFSAGYVFTGVELLLVGLPFVNGAEKIKNRMTAAAGITGAVLVLITAMTIARLTSETAANRTWPLLDMLNGASLPGDFMERKDAVVISLWIISVFFMVGTGLFFSSLLFRDILGKGRQSQYAPGTAFLIGALACMPESFAKTMDYMNKLYRYASPVFMLAVPIILLTIAKVRGIRREAG